MKSLKNLKKFEKFEFEKFEFEKFEIEKFEIEKFWKFENFKKFACIIEIKILEVLNKSSSFVNLRIFALIGDFFKIG